MIILKKIGAAAMMAVFSFVLCFHSFSQPIFIPFRVGDKFGIANEKGEMKLKPVYDNVRLCKMDNYFMCYKVNGSAYTSSLIYKDKIIINDQQYFGYYPYNDIVVAVSHTHLKTWSYYTFGNELSHVYNNKGQRILPDDYSYVDVFTDFDNDNLSNEVLIATNHLNGAYSLYVFDKKQNKVKKQLLDKIEVEEIDANEIHWSKKLTVLTKSIGKSAIRYTISLTNQAYEITQENIEPRSDYDDMFWDAPVAEPGYDDAFPNAPKRKVLPDAYLQTVAKRHDSDAFEKKDRIKITSEKLNPKYRELIKENGKFGLKSVSDSSELLPARYDELFNAEFAGFHFTGYIMRTDKMYGLKIYPFGADAVSIEPIYLMMPWLEKFNYGKLGLHLIGLYDVDGSFHHFANQAGKEYYKAQ